MAPLLIPSQLIPYHTYNISTPTELFKNHSNHSHISNPIITEAPKLSNFTSPNNTPYYTKFQESTYKNTIIITTNGSLDITENVESRPARKSFRGKTSKSKDTKAVASKRTDKYDFLKAAEWEVAPPVLGPIEVLQMEKEQGQRVESAKAALTKAQEDLKAAEAGYATIAKSVG